MIKWQKENRNKRDHMKVKIIKIAIRHISHSTSSFIISSSLLHDYGYTNQSA